MSTVYQNQMVLRFGRKTGNQRIINLDRSVLDLKMSSIADAPSLNKYQNQKLNDFADAYI